MRCAWDSRTCYKAAKKGHFEMLKWAVENGCDRDSGVTQIAAINGRLDILKWAIEDGDCGWEYDTVHRARKLGHTEIVQWAIEHGAPDSSEKFILEERQRERFYA